MLPEEFKERVAIAETGCWDWLLHVDRYGYGKQDGKGAHRLSYELFVGPIPSDMTVDHICWNTRCVNPQHLRLLPLVDNASRQRSALATHCTNSHEFTPENTYYRTQRCAGQRQCRTCNRDAVRRYRARRAA